MVLLPLGDGEMISIKLYRKGFIIYPAGTTGDFTKHDSYVTKQINEVFCIAHDSGYPVSIAEKNNLKTMIFLNILIILTADTALF